jgi:hypothetical protein
MAFITFNRRHTLERRHRDTFPSADRRGDDRRRQAYNGYWLMLGDEGYDGYDLCVLLPLTLAGALLSFWLLTILLG